MKTPPKTFLVAIAAAAGLLLGQLKSVEVPAVTTTVTEAALEQYRVIDLSQVPVDNRRTAPLKLEAILNEQAAQGWRVREIMDSYVILAR
jgi:hypothetical protein